METEKNFWVIGGDLRQVKLVEELRNEGHTVHTTALEKGFATEEKTVMQGEKAHCVILPLPVLKEGKLHAPLGENPPSLADIFAQLHPMQVVCGGLISPEVEALAGEYNLRLVDYYEREECKIANAVPTAEGALQVAMENMEGTLHGARVLVIGFGRVGKITAHRFKHLGAKVTVAARKWEDFAWAEAYGYSTEDSRQLAFWMGAFDLIINTVPHMILDREHLSRVRQEAFIIDLATLPGGVDFPVAKDLGIRAVNLPGIPGKSAPRTAAKAIKESVYHILHEMGV